MGGESKIAELKTKDTTRKKPAKLDNTHRIIARETVIQKFREAVKNKHAEDEQNPAEIVEQAGQYAAGEAGQEIKEFVRTIRTKSQAIRTKDAKPVEATETRASDIPAGKVILQRQNIPQQSPNTIQTEHPISHVPPSRHLPSSPAAPAASMTAKANTDKHYSEKQSPASRIKTRPEDIPPGQTPSCQSTTQKTPSSHPAGRRSAYSIKIHAGTIKVPTFMGQQKTAEGTTKRTAQRICRQRRSLAIQQLTPTSASLKKRGMSNLSRRTVEAAAKAIKSLITAIASLTGTSVFIIILCALFLVGAILASPMGILVSEEASGTSLSSAIAEISSEYSTTLRNLRSGYDSYTVTGHAPRWKDVIAVYACKTAGDDSGTDVLILDAEHVAMMKAVFWDMTGISSEASFTTHEDTDPEDDIDDSWTETALSITVTAKTAEDMALAYNFTDYQIDTMSALLAELDEWDLFAIDLDITDGTALYLLDNLPADLSAERRTVVQYALSLVGKVSYFWGGKSLVLGTDPRWGVSTLVTAAGSSTTGTYRPYGMDCSGFVDWVFYNASDGSYVIGQGGGVIAQHNNCYAISWSEAIPGDLVFYPNDSHIGIVGGWDESGNIQIIHCASGSLNGAVITGKSGFATVGRPYYYEG